MAKKAKCPVCDKWREIRQVRWGWMFKYHNVVLAGKTIECNGSGMLVK